MLSRETPARSSTSSGPAADIAPSSQNGACMAAVCCFSYPKAGQTDKAFAAMIRLKSRETVDQELAAFFQEFNEFEDRVELNGGDDSVTYGEREKFHEQLNLIRGWSGLDRQLLLDLGKNNLASEVTQRCKHGHELFDAKDPQRGVVAVAKDDAREFLLAVKPYVGSTAKAKLLRWPLVEMVDVFVKADILRSGIVLVDLPGEMDALETRSQVARRYYNKLDRLMVMAPGDRAFDNRTAIELIREDQAMDLEADGMIRDSGLCVVVTKVDQMDWRSFVETEWPADEIPPVVLVMMEELEGKRNELSRVEQGDTEPSGLVDRRRAVADEMRRLDALCFGKCIEARSNDTRRTFQEYVDRIRNSMRAKTAAKVSTELDVFPVSSKAHQALARGQPEPAFHAARSTGIDDLKAWMLRGSLPRREEHADGILHRCHVLFDAIGGWAADEGHAAARLPEVETQRHLGPGPAAMDSEGGVGEDEELWTVHGPAAEDQLAEPRGPKCRLGTAVRRTRRQLPAEHVARRAALVYVRGVHPAARQRVPDLREAAEDALLVGTDVRAVLGAARLGLGTGVWAEAGGQDEVVGRQPAEDDCAPHRRRLPAGDAVGRIPILVPQLCLQGREPV